jgi:hypothetical protein
VPIVRSVLDSVAPECVGLWLADDAGLDVPAESNSHRVVCPAAVLVREAEGAV